MKPNPKQPVERQFEQYNQAAEHTAYPVLLYAAILFFMFGVLAVVWAIPFPHIGFLGKYNGYINWASFLIAGVIYYYLQMSPVVSYVLLLLTFAFSYCIIQLEQWQQAGGWPLWLVGAVMLTIGLVSQLLLLRRSSGVKLLLTGPVWLICSCLPVKMRKF
jgi:hypothetical protein